MQTFAPFAMPLVSSLVALVKLGRDYRGGGEYGGEYIVEYIVEEKGGKVERADTVSKEAGTGV